MTDAEKLRAQIPSSTDPVRLERMAQDDERRRLATFACWVLRTAWRDSNVEVAEVHELAEKLGLVVDAPSGYDPERHAEDDFANPGDPYCELAVWLQALDSDKAPRR